MAEEDPLGKVVIVPKFDMTYHVSIMSLKGVKSLAKQYGIPLDLHPYASTEGWTMDKLPKEVIGLYEQFFDFSGVRVPFSTLLLGIIKHFHVHISQLVPLGLNRLTMFELYCRSLSIIPTVSLFRVFYKISKQGHWFYFEKPVGKGARGRIFQETFSGMKGWKDKFFFLDRRAIPDAMDWRHHDFDVNDALPDDGFSILDARALAEKFIDLRLVLTSLVFKAGLASTWDFPGFHPIFKYTKGNVVTMSECLRFPFLFGASIVQGPAVSSKNPIDQNTTPPLPVCHPIPDKTDFQREVEVEDPKVLAIKERKARAATKKKENKKRDKNEGESLKPKTKRKKIPAVKKGQSTTSDHVSSLTPICMVAPTINPLQIISFVNQTRRPLNAKKEEVFLSSPSSTRHSVHYSPSFVKTLSQSGRNLRGMHYDEGESYHFGGIYVPEWSIPRRCRVDSPMWFENLQDDYGKLAKTHGECSDTIQKLVTARQDLEQNARLYTNMSDHYKGLKEEH
ncbi:hypothetical protein Tco_0949169 [Tanacetum coccineum]